MSRDKAVEDYVKRIENSFNRHVVSIMSEVRGNLIIFAFKNSPGKIPWDVLKMRATALEKKYSLPFTAYVAKLRKQHAHNRHALEL
ncbi:MAG: hypothetical protein H0V39_00925 [Nitrosomonas sp.]|nr:hypothetical protein [Nitrosomonas sp.]